MNGEHNSAKGRVSNFIAWGLIVLQTMLTIGGLYSGGSLEKLSFSDMPAIVQTVTFLICFNILGIGSLILSLIVWRYHKNKKGKVTTFAAIVVILFNTLCSCTLAG